jgi:hypothetical protein
MAPRGAWYQKRCEARLRVVCKAHGLEYTGPPEPVPEESEAECKARDKGTRVYFIQRGENGPVKIGVSDEPEERRLTLQTGNVETLHIRCSLPGGRHLEKRLHLLFDRSRLLGEWFHPSPDLRSFMAKPNLTYAWTARLKQRYRRKNKSAEVSSG